jgi:voltage-gated potassium channel
VGTNIFNELRATRRPCVVVDISPQKANIEGKKQFEVLIEGDATDNEILQKAGISTARGLFAVTSDDNMNLVICLTAKHLNPTLRIVSQCNDLKNSDKLKHAGAHAVVSPGYIGGLRMASEMVRPKVVTFLDTMLRDSKAGLRVEEVEVTEALAGKSLKDLDLKRHSDALLLAATGKSGWHYNPKDDYRLEAGDTLVFMTSAADRIELDKISQQAQS